MISAKINKLVLVGTCLISITGTGFVAYAQTGAPVLSQSSVTVGLGQTMPVTAQGSADVYMSYNSNSSVASISINRTQISVTGVQIGSGAASICYVGTATNCTNLSFSVQGNAVQALSFSQTNIALAQGGSQAVTVSGGSGTYSLSGNSNLNVVSTSLSSSTLTMSAVAAGSATITVCDQSSNCGTVNVTVSSSGSSGSSMFSTTNPAVSVGQTTKVSLSGGTTYYLFNNTNSNIVQASVDGDILSLYGASAGSAKVTVCIAGGSCSPLDVTVTGAATGTTTSPTNMSQQNQPAGSRMVKMQILSCMPLVLVKVVGL